MTNTLRFHLNDVPRIVKIRETESRMGVARIWGEGENGELLFIGYRVSVWEDENSSTDA